MNRFIILLFIAFLTFLAVLYVKRPEIISNFILWVIGLAGPVIGLIKRIIREIKHNLEEKKILKPDNNKTNNNTITGK